MSAGDEVGAGPAGDAEADEAAEGSEATACAFQRFKAVHCAHACVTAALSPPRSHGGVGARRNRVPQTRGWARSAGSGGEVCVVFRALLIPCRVQEYWDKRYAADLEPFDWCGPLQPRARLRGACTSPQPRAPGS